MNYKKIKDLCEIKKGKKVLELEEQFDDSVRYIQIDDLRNNNKIKHCSPDSSYVYVGKDDLIIAWDGANAGTVGFNLEGVIGSTLAKISVLDKDIFAPFLALYLQSKFDYFQRTATGATIPHISRVALENLEIPIFSIEQQKYIFNQLLKTKELIEKRQSQITALHELTQSLFLEMFGDSVKNDKNLPKVNFNNYISYLTSGSRGWAKYYSESGELFITIKNVKDGRLFFNDITYVNAPESKEAERTKVQEGDLLLSITADLGRTAVVDKATAEKGGYINQHLALIRLNVDLNPIYLAHFMRSQSIKMQLEKMNQNGVKAGLNFDSIKKLEILVPAMVEQEKFVSILNEIENNEAKLEASLMEMNNLYNSLLQKAFKGELFQG